MQSVNDSRALTGKNKGLNRAERTKVQPGSDRAKQILADLESELREYQAAIVAGRGILASEKSEESRIRLKRILRGHYGKRDRYTRLVKAAKIKANS